jgi:hypothetical protein
MVPSLYLAGDGQVEVLQDREEVGQRLPAARLLVDQHVVAFVCDCGCDCDWK